MSELDNIDDVLKKFKGLGDSLQFSGEIFPLISDVFVFIKEIVPHLLEANSSIQESTSKIPTATENLNNVSKTTELAANEVMDKIEMMTEKLSSVKDLIASGTDKEKQLSIVEDVKNDAAGIIYAFQFQDITTQQLDHVSRILQAIYDKFIELFRSFSKLKAGTNLGGEVIRAIENEFKLTLEKENKDYFENRTEDTMRKTDITQDMIDNLFK